MRCADVYLQHDEETCQLNSVPGGAALTGATGVVVGRTRRSRHPAFSAANYGISGGVIPK
ncbi:hypothetical protein C3Z09_01470 [Lelliottia aquatilis]|nr:hypothetical protein C3Z09_01470 [Lelliottia aquatilis]